MKNAILWCLALSLSSGASEANDLCHREDYNCDDTSLGKLEFIKGKEINEKLYYIYLNGKGIFKADASYMGQKATGQSYDKYYKTNKTIITIHYNKPKMLDHNEYLCRANIVLDFSKENNVIISNEFYPPGYYDAQIDWISWGKKNSVIAFKDGSRFRYQDGHVTMIDDGGHRQSK